VFIFLFVLRFLDRLKDFLTTGGYQYLILLIEYDVGVNTLTVLFALLNLPGTFLLKGSLPNPVMFLSAYFL